MNAKTTNWVKNRILEANPLIDSSSRNGTRDFSVISRKGKLIELDDGTILTEFISCSYLGLEQDARLVEGAIRAMTNFGVQFACARTRVRHSSYDKLEELLGRIYGGHPCVTFSSVTLTHLGVLPLLASGALPSFRFDNQNATFILDKHVHSSVQVNRGLLSQFGQVLMLDLQDTAAIRELYSTGKLLDHKVFFFLDGIGSMAGNGLTKDLIALCTEHDATLYIDDAHGISAMGTNGSGSAHDVLQKAGFKKYLICGSLSKGFGSGGGFVTVPSEEDAQVIRRHSPVFTFSGPLQIPVVGAGIESAQIHLSDEIMRLQDRLWQNVDMFDQLYRGSSINKGLQSPIRGIYFDSDERANGVAAQLRARGFASTLALFPTVAKGKGRIRLAFSALHSPAQIIRIASVLNEMTEPAGKI